MEQTKPKILFLKKEDLIQGDKNYKEYDGLTFHKLVSSITQFGQVMPILVKQHENKYQIVCGGKIYDAVTQVGMNEYFCVQISDPFDILDVLVNELNFKTNYIELSEKLLSRNMSEIERFLPYTDEEIVKIKSIASYDWSKIISKANDIQISLFDAGEKGENEEQNNDLETNQLF